MVHYDKMTRCLAAASGTIGSHGCGDGVRRLDLRYGVRGDLVARRVQVLHLAVIRPLVGHVEGGRDGAAVGVGAALLEQVRVEALVQVVDGVVEREQHDLGHLLGEQVTCMAPPHWPECSEGGDGVGVKEGRKGAGAKLTSAEMLGGV